MKKKHRILIATGGTGGHIYPAIALAQQLQKQRKDIDVLFVGTRLGENRFFNRSGFPFEDVSSGPFVGIRKREALRSCGKVLKGIGQSFRILRKFKPAAVIGFGSYSTLPILTAAKAMGIPILLHEGNSFPGKVNQFFSRFAKVTAIQFPDTEQYLKGKTVEVETPLREGYTSAFASKAKARDYFSLDPHRFTFLTFGGSQGALTLNTLFTSSVLEMADRSKGFQLIHITGSVGTAEETQRFYNELGVDGCVKPFEEHMDLAWIAADLVISRSGAMTIAEQIEFERPGILVPFPYATHDHQDRNADFMAYQVRGALKVVESEADPKMISQTVSHLIANDREQLNIMQEAIREYKRSHRKRDLSSLVCEVAGVRG